MNKKKIYLDNNASTELAPEVLQAYIEALHIFGNPSSMHSYGQKAKAALMQARDSIASFFSVKPKSVIFTSSATEALNMVIRGFFLHHGPGHIITTTIEHPAIYNTVQALEKKGCSVTYIQPLPSGVVAPEHIEEAITSDTKMIALSQANSETGAIMDLEKIASIARERGIHCISDSVQMVGKAPFQCYEGVSAYTFSAHKIHGPKGVGVAIIDPRFRYDPLLTGGYQEFSKRAGTENLPAIVAAQKAFELLKGVDFEEMKRKRDRFEEVLFQNEKISLNATSPSRLFNTSNVHFKGKEGEILLMELDRLGVCASHGSACSTGALEPSRILLEMGYSREHVSSSVRFSLSRYTTFEEIEKALSLIHSL